MSLGPGAAAQGALAAPNSARAQRARQLDLAGQTEPARLLWEREVAAAATPADRAAAERELAMSWAFAGNCRHALSHEQRVINYWRSQESTHPEQAFFSEAERAEEAAQVCLNLGDLDAAASLYREAHARALLEPHLPMSRHDQWEFRYQQALARLAARRGDRPAAERYAARARAILERLGTEDLRLQQLLQLYAADLRGYIAFYAGDLRQALVEFQHGKVDNPTVALLMGRCYEQAGQREQARAAYRVAAAAATHDPAVAYARPNALRRLAFLGGA